jgi:polysaccharide chain length determinant protein (PEP-CTERM system associated)
MSTRRDSLAHELLSYVEVPIRRPLQVLFPLLIVMTIALVLAFTMPEKYRTATLILVEEQEVPKSFVQTTENPARPRLLTIRQEILSRTRLEQVIKELDPYPERTGQAALTDILETMRAAVSINVKGEDAFTIEYVHRSASMAQAVANRLAGLFIEETMRAREEQVTSAVSFIETQLTDARRELELKEQALRKFKEARMGSLPEQTGSNLATLQRLQLEQQSLAASLQSARQRLTQLDQGSTDPGPTPGASSRYEPSELATLRARLAELQERYTAEHPDIEAVLARIARLEGTAVKTSDSGSAAPSPVRSSPLLDQARLEVKDLEGKIANVDRRIQEFQQRVENTPRAEQELANLTRDHNMLQQNYLQLLNKKIDAQMAERLEERWKGEQFRVLDPAFLPEQPYSPNRRLIAVVGLVLGLLAGLTLAYTSEFLDSSVKGVRDLEVLAPLPLLGLLSAVDGGGAGVPTRPGPLSGLRHLLQRRREKTQGNRRDAVADVQPPSERDPGASTTPARRPPVFEESEGATHQPRRGVAAAAVMARGAIFEQFRAIGARIRALDGEKPLRCIGVVSAVAGEGKSTAALGLAAALGQGAARVLLVEADVRRPVLSEYLGVPPTTGLAEWLLGSEEPISVQRVARSRFFLLPAGLGSAHFEDGAFVEPSEVEGMRVLIEEARRSFDFVIVDCPPLLPVADAMVLQRMVDGFVVVVRERHAPIESILYALDRVDAERLRGVVLNDHLEVLRRYERYQQGYYRKTG